MIKAACVLACLSSPAYGNLDEKDLKRARTWTPRSGYRGQGKLASANEQLNKHLSARQGIMLKACEEFSVAEVRDVLRTLLRHADSELVAIYSEKDGRRAVYKDIEEMERHWEQVPNDDLRVRDALCHEAVMWFVHHVPNKVQEMLSMSLLLPKLPVDEHKMLKGSTRPVEDKAGHFYDSKVTCQNCHVGGIANLGVPEVAPKDAKAKARRCYTNYEELFNVECGPCDGIAGPYSGDDDKYFTQTECIVVAQPHEVNESDRVQVHIPPQFSVDVVGGSDRFGRTTNPVHDQLPGPIAKIYGQISGKWFMDAKPGADLWLLRHDTTYASVTENGIPIPFAKAYLSEIHAQTAKQRSTNVTGPMVSIIHGLPSWVPGGCTCMPDPVGVPDTQASWAKGMAGMQYMGRIKLPELEYLKVPIELDHWANWFFHIFMDTNKSKPHYGKAPSRLASAYAGTAVYDNWIMEDPKIRDPTVWHREIPTTPEKVGPDKGKYCMDTKHSPICANISQDTFPPKGEPADAVDMASTEHPHLPFFPSAHQLAAAVSARTTEIVV